MALSSGRLGGRPKKDRAAKKVTEAAQERANLDAIIQVFKDAVHPGQPMGLRVKAAQAWLDVEQKEGRLLLEEEDQDNKHHSRDELLEILASRLTEGAAAPILRSRLQGDVVEGTVVEDGDEA